MIKELLSKKNEHKRVVARSGDLSIVEIFGRIDASNVVHLRYALARTDAEGNAHTDDGIILNSYDLQALPDLIASADIRESCPAAAYFKDGDKPKAKTLLW